MQDFFPRVAAAPATTWLTRPNLLRRHHEASLLEASSDSSSSRTLRRVHLRTPEMLEDWQDSGAAATTLFSESELDSLEASITGQAYGAQLHAFIDPFTSRFVANPANRNAAALVEEEFRKFGMEAWHQPLTIARPSQYSGYKGQALNVIGRLNGTDLAHEVIVLGAHLDSVNWENTTGSAPGVDDNGSGISLLLMVARALAKAKPRRTILFTAFNAEELGCLGSKEFVTLAKDGRYGQIISAVIADEVAFAGANAAKRGVIFETVGTIEGTSGLLDTFAHINQGMGLTGINRFKVNKHGFSSDHISFLDAGIPTVLLIELDNMNHADMYGHSARDTFEHVNFDYGAAMTRLALRAVATLASPRT